MLILEENFRRHLEVFASELSEYIYIQRLYLICVAEYGISVVNVVIK